jgi:hypothetical protein
VVRSKSAGASQSIVDNANTNAGNVIRQSNARSNRGGERIGWGDTSLANPDRDSDGPSTAGGIPKGGAESGSRDR